MAGPLTVAIAVPNVVTTSVPGHYVVAPNLGQEIVQLNGSVVGVGPDIAQLLKYRWYSDRYVAERYVDKDPDQSPIELVPLPPLGERTYSSSVDAPLSLGRHALCLVASDAVGAEWARSANWVGVAGGDSKVAPFVLHVVRAAWAIAAPPPARATPSTAITIESGLLTGELLAEAPTVWKEPPPTPPLPPRPPRPNRAMVMGWAIRKADTSVLPNLIEWTEATLTVETDDDSNRRVWHMDLANLSVGARRAAAEALALAAGRGPELFEVRLSCRDAALSVSHLSAPGYFSISRPPS